MAEEKQILSFEKLNKLLNGLISIHEISSYSSTNSLHTLCEVLLNSCCHLVDSNRASIMIYDERSNELKIVASRGITPTLVEQIKLSPGVGIAGMAFESGEALVVENPKVNPHFVDYFGIPEQEEPMICIPMKTRDKVLGIVNVHSKDFSLISSQYVRKMLVVLAGKAALAMESMDLFDTLNNRNFEMVETLTRALDAKDHYTHDHAGRAKIKAEQICRALSLPEKKIVQVKYAALLHDIGKLGIPENILLKPGRLTDEEYHYIKKHPEIGYQILIPVEFLAEVAKIVLYHQEWYNGKGYPHAIAGDKIPLGARIISVIDSWDAMVSDRPYRKALSYEKAVDELKKGKGTQFDPKIIDIFFALETTAQKNKINGIIFE